MNNNVKIFVMTIDDLNSIHDTLETEFDNFWNYSVFKAELENDNSYILVAKIENEIVGFVSIWYVLNEFHITNLVTKKDKRNMGIASSLIQTAIDYSIQNNADFLTLEVNENNKSAIHLYNKFNFEKVGLRKKYYNGKDNAIIMTKNFIK